MTVYRISKPTTWKICGLFLIQNYFELGVCAFISRSTLVAFDSNIGWNSCFLKSQWACWLACSCVMHIDIALFLWIRRVILCSCVVQSFWFLKSPFPICGSEWGKLMQEVLRDEIISVVKQSAALNRTGAENMKPRQLSDAIHDEIR